MEVAFLFYIFEPEITKMKNLTFIFVMVILGSSCSRQIMQAKQPQKFYDEYFILRKNGHYHSKWLMFGVFPMSESTRGRYIRSNDTVYFVTKEKKNLYNTYGYGIIDSSTQTFTYRFSDTAELKTLSIRRSY